MKKNLPFILVSGLLGTTALAPAALAQDASAEKEQVMSVYERYRPDYDAPGIRTGSFLFYPTVEAGLKSNSNIYLQESGVTDDFIAVIKPSFSLVSDWSSDYFSLKAGAEVGRFFDNGDEDYEDFDVALSGRKDISRGTSFSVDASYVEGHEDRGSPDANGNQVSPAENSTANAKLGFKRDLSVLSFAANVSFEKKDFDDVDLNGGGIKDNDFRDRDRRKAELRLGYEMADGYEAFIRSSMDRVEYDNSKANGGPQRNSDGFEVVGGAAFDLTGTAKGEFFVGYMKREYDSDTLGSTDGIKFGATLTWNPSDLTTFIGSVSRNISETTLAGDADAETTARYNGNPPEPTYSSGSVDTLVSARVEHELRRNILLNISGSLTKMNYQLITREDDMLAFGAGAKYLLNRNMQIETRYDYKYRDTNVVNSDYSAHSFMVNLKAQW
ncbi:MAG: outer membrane beta-barrel protein [Alphaproteobacteria bacterium]|nr:outer membrane beta-barrel protein [Alphaproteobacteria bacterium]